MVLTTSETNTILTELETAFFDIPFENSDFQNEVFVVAAQQTPGRAYRAIGLRMFAKIRAVKELEFSRKLSAVDIDEKKSIIENPSTNTFERRRAEIEIERIHSQQNWTDKLLNDALRELNCLYAEFKKFPQYTREEFEKEERIHFQLRGERQAIAGGSVESLANIQVDDQQLDNYLQNPSLLESDLNDKNRLLLTK